MCIRDSIQTSARHGVPSGRRRRLRAFSQRLRGRRTPQGRRARNGASACRRQMKTRTSVVAVMIRTLRQRRRHEPFQFAVRLGGTHCRRLVGALSGGHRILVSLRSVWARFPFLVRSTRARAPPLSARVSSAARVLRNLPDLVREPHASAAVQASSARWTPGQAPGHIK